MAARRNRRDFLKLSTLSSLGYWAAGGISLAGSQAPSEKVNIACIGVGGKGSSDTDHAGQVGNVVAICDIDDNFLNRKAEKFPHAKKYNDYRKMLDEMGKQIDAVTVSTPDHTHAPASMMAMKMGKHVYCQKPMTHTVYEARVMRETAAKMKLATQLGNQGTAENGLRTAVEMIQAGVIGPVREVHVWTNRPVWPQAPQVVSRPAASNPPSHVHWDLFLGSAPERPFATYPDTIKASHRGAYHDFNWRGWWDFGTGALGDMACHTANMAFMACKLGYPTSVVGECGDLNPETYPSWASVKLEFPARGDMPPLKFCWYEGQRDGKKNLPPAELMHGEKPPGSGSLIVGDKGVLYSPDDYGARFKLLPTDKFVEVKKPDPSLARNGKGDLGMKQEWVAAIKGGPAAFSNFNYSGMLTEAILLGNVAIRTGKKLEWDGPNMRFTNAPDANQFLHCEYRKGWTL